LTLVASLILLIALAAILLVALVFSSSEGYQASRASLVFVAAGTKTSSIASQLEEFDLEFNRRFSFLASHIGSKAFLKLLLPALVLVAFCCLYLAPLITDTKYGLILGLLMSLAYLARVFFVWSAAFRAKLLSQLERILLSIRNNLSTGMTLDYAVSESSKYNPELPLGPHLSSFMRLSDINFIENFPLWIIKVQKTFRLKDLAKSAQLLSLELCHTNNQEQAFMNAVAAVSACSKRNKKQQNTLNITFFTLDFLVLAFLGILFYVVPSFSTTAMTGMDGLSTQLSWWDTPHRVLVVFQAALVIWSAYAATVLIALGRQS